MEFGEKLKQYRKEAGFTQGDLASRINVTQKDIVRWENGVFKPNIF
ncbi:MAG: helix-turn-helix transcriptional regulator [Parasporobacterium sp.]|nr:helix-turn-helix transcriptional regulator [Parasporobacterium sp.]